MKKQISFILTLVIMIGLLTSPLKVSAATMSSKAGRVSITSGTLNVRKSASTSSTVLISLKQTNIGILTRLWNVVKCNSLQTNNGTERIILFEQHMIPALRRKKGCDDPYGNGQRPDVWQDHA